MIVICTKCQAKFRVADEKIGPRGAKVRCSRCQTVFAVHLDLGVVPESPPAADGSPAQSSPVARSLDRAPPPLPPPLPPPTDDLYAAAFAPHAPEPEPDPFANADPFAAPAEPAGRSTLPVTDLSDLLGATSPATPDPFDEPAHAAEDLPPTEPPRPFEDGGLALEERLTPPPLKVARPLKLEPEPPLEIATEADAHVDPFALAPGQSFDPGALDFAGEPGDDPFAAAMRGPTPGATSSGAAPEPAAAVVPSPLAGPEILSRPPGAPRRPIAPRRDHRVPGQRSSLRAAAVNAVALAVLLAVALAILVVWRSEGSLDAGSFRPSAILATLRGGGAAAGPFAIQDVRSGVYERERAAPLLFVRGKVVSRAPASIAALRVSVQVVRAGEVLARGDAIAGAVPTPEELYASTDGAALARAVKAARARAPAVVRPGDAVPFLVAVGDAPADLEGAALRLEVAPAGSKAQ